MKQIVCKEPNHFEMREVPMPTRRPREALIKIQRMGICGTDIHAFHGNQPYFTYPRVLGHELSGTIVELDSELGNHANGLRTGDQVSIIPYLHCGACIACRSGKTNCCTQMQVIGVHVDGGMGEYISVPIPHLVPTSGLNPEQSAVLEPLSIGAHAVRRSGLQAGATALVVGAGPIGLAAMVFAMRQGAKVIAMDVNEERLAFCKTWARVDGTVNALSEPQTKLARLTGGDFPTVVFDATGNTKSMSACVSHAAHGGTLVYIGLVQGDVSFSDPEFHKRELTIMGSRNATPEDFSEVKRSVEEGLVDVAEYVTHRIPFDHIVEVFEDLTKPDAKVIKAVIEF